MQKWFLAIGILFNAKKSVSSCQLARDVELNQKSAWFMAMRIRMELAKDGNAELMQGIVEADECYIGGKPRKRNRHDDDTPSKRGRGTDKMPVIGVVERGGRVAARPAEKSEILVRDTGVPDEVAEFWRVWMGALRKTNPPLLAYLSYLSYMVIRLAHMRVLLRPTGSLYLHCDTTASHYIKVLLDGVFGHANFRNDITWQRSAGFKRKTARRFPQKNDTILFYAKDFASLKFNTQFSPHKPEYVKRFKPDEHGRLHRTDVNPTAGGRRTIYLDETEGDILDAVWTDIPPSTRPARSGWDTPPRSR